MRILLRLLIGLHGDGLEVNRLQVDGRPVGVDFGPYRRVGNVHVAHAHLDAGKGVLRSATPADSTRAAGFARRRVSADFARRYVGVPLLPASFGVQVLLAVLPAGVSAPLLEASITTSEHPNTGSLPTRFVRVCFYAVRSRTQLRIE